MEENNHPSASGANIPQVSSTPEQNMPPSQGKKIRIPKIILKIITVLVLLVIGFLGLNYYIRPQENQVLKVFQPTIIPIEDPLANWKMHQNEEFSIKYPEKLDGLGYSFRYESDDECIYIRIETRIPTSGDIESWIKSNRMRKSPSLGATPFPPTLFPYINSVDTNIKGYWFEQGSEVLGKNIIVKLDNKFVEFEIPGCAAGDNYKYHPKTQEILENMIPTFKFVE